MIVSKDNNKIKYLKRLYAKARFRKKEGCFVAEGFKMIDEALKRGLVREIFLSETESDKISVYEKEVPVEIVEKKLFDSVADTVTPQGIIAVAEIEKRDIKDILSLAGDCNDVPADGAPKGKCHLLALENVRDPGNIGTMIRTALGAGFDGILLSGGCADVYQPKVVRSTMGALFSVPCIETGDDFISNIQELGSQGFRIVGAAPAAKAGYRECDYGDKCVIMIGNEANGLSEAALNACNVNVSIPMEGGLESLNASVAAALMMYEVFHS